MDAVKYVEIRMRNLWRCLASGYSTQKTRKRDRRSSKLNTQIHVQQQAIDNRDNIKDQTSEVTGW